MTLQKPHRALLGLLLLVVILVYAGTLDANFVRWDDDITVYQNPYFPLNSVGTLVTFWTSGYQQLYSPVTLTVWGIISTVAHSATSATMAPKDATTLNPAPFHFLNLVVHLSCTVLVYRLLRRLSVGPGGSLLGAAIFGLHPIQVESVAWITSFKELSCTFFGLIAIHCQIEALESESRPNRIRWSIAATVAFTLAILSLPLAMSVPLICLVVPRAFKIPLTRRAIFGPALWLCIGLAVAAYTKVMQPTDAHFAPVSIGARFAVAGDSLLFYAGKILWPFNFCIDYGRTPATILSSPLASIAATIPFIVFGAIAILWKRGSLAAFALAFFTFNLLPVLGFVPFVFQRFSTVADRYAYAAMIGVALAAALIFDRIASRGLVPTVSATAGSVAICLFLAFQTTMQTIVWHDSRALFSHAIEVNPRAWGQHNNLSLVLLDAGQLAPALREADAAVQYKPDFREAWLNRGTILVHLGRYPEAKTCFEKIIQLDPAPVDGYFNLAVLYFGLGDKPNATKMINEALKRQPNWSTALDLQQKIQSLPNP